MTTTSEWNIFTITELVDAFKFYKKHPENKQARERASEILAELLNRGGLEMERLENDNP